MQDEWLVLGIKDVVACASASCREREAFSLFFLKVELPAYLIVPGANAYSVRVVLEERLCDAPNRRTANLEKGL